MSSGTLYDKVWDAHTVRQLEDGRTQLFIGLHLVHEVTSPQAFAMLRERGLKVAYPEHTFATLDHVIPTVSTARPFADAEAEAMASALEANVAEHGIRFFGVGEGQGIVHVVGPEQGLTQPGMTICCGDSHTSTHGAFGAIAFGMGTTQVRDVLATQTLALQRLKVRQVRIEGTLGPGVYAKDVALHVIRTLGVGGGTGFAYEFAGSVVEQMTMEGRMTLCNMAIEGGARVGYVNPDATTYAYLRGRPFASEVHDDGRWCTEPDAVFDDVVVLDGGRIAPTVTWGIHPGQAVAVHESIPEFGDALHEAAVDYMGVTPGVPLLGQQVDVAFIGSCTNSRIEDLRAVARAVRGRRVHPQVRALVVPGSEAVARQAEAEGVAETLRAAGFEWRRPGCSMCLAMNPDRLVGRELCASSSNRNFRGRQGSATGRTVLMSPVMVAAAAVEGRVADARRVFGSAA